MFVVHLLIGSHSTLSFQSKYSRGRFYFFNFRNPDVMPGPYSSQLSLSDNMVLNHLPSFSLLPSHLPSYPGSRSSTHLRLPAIGLWTQDFEIREGNGEGEGDDVL